LKQKRQGFAIKAVPPYAQIPFANGFKPTLKWYNRCCRGYISGISNSWI